MCSYITEKAPVFGSAKGAVGWMKIDTANVYFDHPYHAPLDHSLNIDFVNEAEGAPQRVAIEISADSARLLVENDLQEDGAGEVLAGLCIDDVKVDALEHHLLDVGQRDVAAVRRVVQAAVRVFLDRA